MQQLCACKGPPQDGRVCFFTFLQGVAAGQKGRLCPHCSELSLNPSICTGVRYPVLNIGYANLCWLCSSKPMRGLGQGTTAGDALWCQRGDGSRAQYVKQKRLQSQSRSTTLVHVCSVVTWQNVVWNHGYRPDVCHSYFLHTCGFLFSCQILPDMHCRCMRLRACAHVKMSLHDPFGGLAKTVDCYLHVA